MERIESSESITVSTPPQLSLRDGDVCQYDGPPPRRLTSRGPRVLMYGEEEHVVPDAATQSEVKHRASYHEMAPEPAPRRTVVVPFWCPFICQGATVGRFDGEVQLPVTVYEGADLHVVAAQLGPQRLNEFELMSLRDQYGDQTIRQLMKEELDREQATGIAIVIENEVEDQEEGHNVVLNPDSQFLVPMGPITLDWDPHPMVQQEMEDVEHEMPIADEAVAPLAYGAHGHYAYPWP
jgi:hypothetical protein